MSKKRRRLLIIPAILIFLIFLNSFGGSKAAMKDTSLPIKIEYLNKVDTKGYLILKERVYTSAGKGVVDYNVRDSERVPKDYIVANLSLMGDVSKLKDELLRIQSAIEYKNQSLNPSSSNYKMTEKEINLISSIQDALVNDNLPEALYAIETLELNTKKNIDISEIGELINLSNQELEDRRDELSKEISTNNIVYKSEIAGVVSFKMDGLEEIYSEENIEKMDYEFIKENQPKAQTGQQNSVEKGDALYKLIDNFDYYMAIPVEDKNTVNGIKIGDDIELSVDSSISLRGKVTNINSTDAEAVIIVKLEEKLAELGYDRVHNVGIIINREEAYVIDSDSVIELDGKLGVYVKELNGIVKFKPIEIIKQDDVETIISMGNEKGNIIDKDGKETATVSIYDELINEPSKIEEGQIIK